MANQSTFHMPSTYSREAPRFSDDASGFDTFFDDVEELAGPSKANLSDADTIKWAVRYAGSEADSWKCVPCYGRPATTFAQFKSEVLKCYPQLSADRRHTFSDLTRLTERVSEYRRFDKEDLGKYYRQFLTLTTYLLKENRLSQRERNAAFLKGFPQPVRVSILQRLAIKKPDVRPDDGYDMADTHAAAEFVLDAGSGESSATSQPVIAVKSEPVEQGSISELIQAMSQLTRVFTANAQQQQQPPSRPRSPSYSTTGVVAQNPPRWQRGQSADSFVRNCMFCSDHDHLVRDCPSAAEYLRVSKIVRDENGRLGVPEGANLSQYSGRNLRERVDSYWNKFYEKQSPPSHLATAVNFLEGPDECVFAIDINAEPPTNPATPSENDNALFEAQMLQIQIESLRDAQVLALEKGKRKFQFDGVEIMKRQGPPKPGAPLPPPPSGPTVHARGQPMSRESAPVSAPSKPYTATPNVIGRPGTRAGADSPQRPQGPMRPVNIPPKPTADDPKFRYHSAIESCSKPSDLTERALDAKITISTRELLAASPDVRRQVKDLVTSKKVSANSVEVDEVDAVEV
jgi:hypothetical protein